jgi:hypothetical protein
VSLGYLAEDDSDYKVGIGGTVYDVDVTIDRQ